MSGRTRRRPTRLLAFALAAAVFSPTGVLAQQAGEAADSYKVPPAALAQLADAPRTPLVSVSPDAKTMLVMELPPMPPIADLARPEMKLAGLRFDAKHNGPTRITQMTGLLFKSVDGQTERRVEGLPAQPRISGPVWAPDGSRVAFTLSFDYHLELWQAEVATGRASRVGDVVLNAAHPARAYRWLPDSRSLVVRTIPANRAAAPTASAVPAGPVIQENIGRKSPGRT